MNPTTGDIFLIPLLDGRFAVGQVIAFETRALHCVSCGLFDQPVSDRAAGESLILDENQLFSCVLVFHVHFLKKKWPIVGNQKLKVPKKFFPFEKELKKGGVGAKILSEGIFEDFVNAFYGCKPWDLYKNPNYFDELLIDPSKKPSNLIYKEK